IPKFAMPVYPEVIQYHKVFHYPTSEVIYFEFKIINKLYGVKDWDFELEFQIDFHENYTGDDPILLNTIRRHVSKDEKEILMKETVEISDFCACSELMECFEATLRYGDIISRYMEFTIVSTEEPISKTNPFFSITDFHLYSEDSDQIQTVFNINNPDIKIQFEIETYFNDELICRPDTDFIKYELLFALTNPKGRIYKEHWHEGELFRDDTEYLDIEPDKDFFKLKDMGLYQLYVFFFGIIIAEYTFRIADYEEVTETGDSRPHKIMRVDPDNESCSLDFMELDDFLGLHEIKNEIKSIISMIDLRREKGELFRIENKKPGINFTFSGNAGTGKTKLAVTLGKIFECTGYLDRSTVTVMNNLSISPRHPDKAGELRNILKSAEGGILMIENACELLNESGEYSIGKTAVNLLMKEITSGSRNTIIIASGHYEEMKCFLKMNPGIASKFRYNFIFPDYTPDELLSICKKKANAMKYTISDDAVEYIEENLDKILSVSGNYFRNASGASEIIECAESNFTKRIIGEKSITDVDKIPLRLEKEDFEGVFDRYLPSACAVIETDDIALEYALTELNRLTGITEIKRAIEELAKRCRYYNEEKIDKKISLHSVFTGNPGTGKTSVARILAKIYKSLGLLERGHLVECDRASLVGEYIGHTAAKTEKLIQEAIGGVLFIDEAYSLAVDGRDFGSEAVEILLKRMEDHRGKFAVICAGYSDEMDKFLKSNPGLKSRFDNIYAFPDYSAEELFKIATDRFKDLGLDYSGVLHNLTQIIGRLCRGRNRYFGNAREIRTLIDKISAKHDLRVADIPKAKRTEKIKHTLTEKDLDTGMKFYDEDDDTDEKPKIGFTI
ncbi:MAG: AAA family ATPase, partial [Ignavibacteria bacterium]|nr:AAA family ATPase [Ignavibacteria bacterium]